MLFTKSKECSNTIGRFGKQMRELLCVKKIAFLSIWVLLIVGLFYGCGSNSVSTSQIKEDIIASEEIQTCFSSSYTDEGSFELDKYELIKEQINEEDKEDIVYAAISVKNTYFKVDLNVKCVYDYFDKGGWILDELVIESIDQITPIGAPSKKLVTAYITDDNVVDDQYFGEVLCSYEGENVSITNGTLAFLDWEYDGIYATLHTRYQSDILTVEGCYTLLFEENDWRFSNENDEDLCMEVISYTSDYSSAMGSYTLESDFAAFDPQKYYGSLKINKIDDGVANYDLYFWLAAECSAKEGTNLTATFDDLTGTLRIGSYLSGDDMCLRYDCEQDCWVEGMYNRFVR